MDPADPLAPPGDRHSSEERAREAERQLQEIRDPVAVNPLVRVLGQDDVPFRMLLDQVLATDPGPRGRPALVGRLLPSRTPRSAKRRWRGWKPGADANIVPTLVKALRSTNPEVVNRAAWALSSLGAVATVPGWSRR